MKNLINFFIQLFKSEWNRPQEKSICESKIINRIWILIPVIYVVVMFSFGFDVSKISSILSTISCSLFIFFLYLWVAVDIHIKEESLKPIFKDMSKEEINKDAKMRIPRLVLKFSAILTLLGLITMLLSLILEAFS